MVTPTASERRQNVASRILLELGSAGDDAGEQGNDEAGDEPAGRHRIEVEPGQQESNRCSGQDGMRHGIAHEAHPPQHQEHAMMALIDRCGVFQTGCLVDTKPSLLELSTHETAGFFEVVE
jgi:hypothetical protein